MGGNARMDERGILKNDWQEKNAGVMFEKEKTYTIFSET